MKDAIGSSVLFYVILIFLAIFIIFIAFIMKYATAFRASNYVVTMIERTEGEIDLGDSSSKAGDDDIVGALKSRLYHGYLKVSCEENDRGGVVYKVTTSIGFNLPLFNVHVPIYINNETKTIYETICNPELESEIKETS